MTYFDDDSPLGTKPKDDLEQFQWIARKALDNNDLGEGIKALRVLLQRFNFPRRHTELDALDADYSLMLDIVRKGYQDSQRQQVYRQLCGRLVRIAADCVLDYRLTHEGPLAAMAQKYLNYDFDEDDIQRHLENFVQDVAMLSLEGGEHEAEHRAGLYEKHYAYVNRLFEALVFSHQWSPSFQLFVTQLLLSPTIDSNDAQLLTSAIMLGALLNYDPQKLLSLITIYTEAQEEHIRQRALVGWMFAYACRPYVHSGGVERNILKLLEDEAVRKEILELEMQFYYCANAEKDNEQMQRDIIPTLMKNKGFEITPEGIKEKDDDPMDDILHGDETDRRMEELEKSMQKMMDMRKQGADIYFGGFRQMKRFAFFYTLSNWFIPFFVDHPQLQSVSPQVLHSSIGELVGEKGPFCESDKYSFIIALSSVFNRLPKNIQELMSTGAGIELPYSEELSSAAYIRRMYLQDLYRFFKLCDMRKAFQNPFDDTRNLGRAFIHEKVFREKSEEEARSLKRFYYKKKLYAKVLSLSNAYANTTAEDFVMAGYSYIHTGELPNAVEAFKAARQLDEDHEAALKGLAQASLYMGRFEEADQCYAELLSRHPDNKLYLLNRSIAQVNSDQVDDGLQGLYQLRYEREGDLRVSRALAWGLLMAGRFADAHQLYSEIVANEAAVTPVDYLNMAYGSWLNGDLEAAIPMLKKYLELSQIAPDAAYYELCQCFKNDRALLSRFHVSDLDCKLVADIVAV